jgi:aryl-alcohol dehydrogenase-like predicted oxidoreductase
MQYRQLGSTDIQVSTIALGTMTWGEQNTEADAHAQLDLATDYGVNLIDAAEMYPVPPKPETQGLTERYLGTWLKKAAPAAACARRRHPLRPQGVARGIAWQP